jgi:hypothetical protein
MFERFCRYRKGATTLADAGYFCLTAPGMPATFHPMKLIIRIVFSTGICDLVGFLWLSFAVFQGSRKTLARSSG